MIASVFTLDVLEGHAKPDHGVLRDVRLHLVVQDYTEGRFIHVIIKAPLFERFLPSLLTDEGVRLFSCHAAWCA